MKLDQPPYCLCYAIKGSGLVGCWKEWVDYLWLFPESTSGMWSHGWLFSSSTIQRFKIFQCGRWLLFHIPQKWAEQARKFDGIHHITESTKNAKKMERIRSWWMVQYYWCVNQSFYEIIIISSRSKDPKTLLLAFTSSISLVWSRNCAVIISTSNWLLPSKPESRLTCYDSRKVKSVPRLHHGYWPNAWWRFS